MNHKNIECKAKVAAIEPYEAILKTKNPIFKGTDHQIDTYYKATFGRLKLREGTIENALIQYNRANTADAKLSEIILYQHQPNDALKKILETQIGIKIVVDKLRKIYFIDNVKFHFDEVKNLGTFIEIEAIDSNGTLSIEHLTEQCNFYINLLGIKPEQFIDKSYSDLILELNSEVSK